jgi:pimeloyl-ACP methyl ester carboxylesterase
MIPRKRVNGYDMAYVEVGSGEPLLCIHGSLCDFRVWSSVLGLLSRHHRVVTPSLRHFFPEHWDGSGSDFTIAQHVDDVIAFIEAMGGPVNLLGHSRGGHISFRVAQKRPDLLQRVILAEPGGDLDPSLAPAGVTAPPPMRSHTVVAAERIAAGDIDGGLESFVDTIMGAGAWRTLPVVVKQELRDNAMTLLGQVSEQRQPYTRADAEAIRVPALFIGGSDTPGSLPVILRALAAHVPHARMEIIPHTGHVMFEDDPVRFSEIVTDFVAGRS